MATSGIKTVQFTEYDTLRYSWEVTSYNASTKESTITWKAEIIAGEHGKIESYNSKSWSLKVMDYDLVKSTTYEGDAYISIDNNQTKQIASGTYVVRQSTAANGRHNVVFNINIDITFNGQPIDEVDFQYTTTIGSPPTGGSLLDAANFTDEENPTIKYALDYTFVDSFKAELVVEGYSIKRDIPTTATGSYTFVITDEERTALRNACANTASTKATFYLTTVFGGDTFTNHLVRTFTIVNAYPTLNPVITNNRDVDFILKGDNSLSVTYNGVAYKGATIKSQYVTYDGKKSGSVITDVSNEVITVTVVDSRGLSTSKDITLSLVPYVKLTCVIETHKSGIKADDTIDITFDISGAFYNGSFNDGGSGNAITLEYRYKENSSDYTEYEWKEVTISGNSYSTEIVFNTAYQNEITLECKVNDSHATVITTSEEVKVTPIFDWGKDDFNFNVPVTINGNPIVYIVEEGTYNPFTTITSTFNYRKWSDGNAEIWGSRTFNNVNVYTTWGDSMYTTGLLSNSSVKYPTNFFIERPNVQVSLGVGSVGGILMSPGGAGDSIGGITQTGSYEIARASSIGGSTFRIDYYIRGKWRE